MDEKRKQERYEYNSRIYTDEAIGIFNNEIVFKDYEITLGEAKIIAPLFADREVDTFTVPLDEFYVLSHHSSGLSRSDMLFQFHRKVFQRETKEYFKGTDLIIASYYAEDFFIRWFSYFDKLSHIMNFALGFPLTTASCSFHSICEKEDVIRSLDNELIQYLATIYKDPIYEEIKSTRHDLIHRFLTSFSFAGSVPYGAEVTKDGEKKEILFDKSCEPYTIDDIYKLISEATDLLVEIKSKMISYPKPQDIPPGEIMGTYK